MNFFKNHYFLADLCVFRDDILLSYVNSIKSKYIIPIVLHTSRFPTPRPATSLPQVLMHTHNKVRVITEGTYGTSPRSRQSQTTRNVMFATARRTCPPPRFQNRLSLKPESPRRFFQFLSFPFSSFHGDFWISPSVWGTYYKFLDRFAYLVNHACANLLFIEFTAWCCGSKKGLGDCLRARDKDRPVNS